MGQTNEGNPSDIPVVPEGPAHRLRGPVDGLLLLAYSAQVMVFWSVGKEDAFICYRYARNLVRGEGLVYNPGEYVEGISNPLWTLLLALLTGLGVPIDAANNLMVLSFAVAAFLVFRRVFLRVFGDTWTARLPLFLLVCMTSMTAGFGNGLEGSATACAAAVMLAGAAAAAPCTMALGVAMMLTLRPEGFVYAGWALCWLLAANWRDGALRRRVMVCAAVAAGAFAALTIFRLSYYGDFLPNTVRAKAAPLSWGVLESGINYVGSYLWRTGPILLLLVAVGWVPRRYRGLWLFAAGMTALNMAVSLRNGGDWMSGFRLLTPFYGLLAFMAGLSAYAAHPPRRWVAVAVGTACIAGGLWTVQPDLILRHVPEFRFAVSGMWREPVDFDRLFDPHVSLADFRGKDNRVLSEWGGAPAYALDGIPVTEMWGLADRDIATGTGPGTHLVPGCGQLCWPAAFAKDPTLLLFWHRGLPTRISSIAELPETRGEIARFLAVQDVAMDSSLRMFNLIFARSDLGVMSKLLLHYGAIAPALDYDDPTLYGIPFIMRHAAPTWDNEDAAVRTPWQKGGWTSEDGDAIPTAWLDWDDDRRLSSKLLLHPGTNRFFRELPDDAPIALLFGRFPLFAPRVRARVLAQDANGDSLVTASADWSDPHDREFILNPLPVPGWQMVKPARMVVELETDTSCAVFLAAHRWSREPFPELPARFVADTRLDAPALLQVPDMPDPKAAVEQLRAEVEASPEDGQKRFLYGAALARAGDWATAEPHLRRVLSLDRSAWPAGGFVYGEEAERRHRTGDARRAADLFRTARLLDPSVSGHAVRLAEILISLGELDTARALCREVPANAREFSRAADLVDEIYGQRGDLQGRVTRWRGVVESNFENAVAQAHYGEALAATGNLESAEAAFRRSLAAAPANGETAIALADLLARRGRCDQALALCSDAVAADRSVAGIAVRNMADAAQYREAAGDLAGALCLLRGACALNPPDPGDLLLLGTALERAGDAVAALEVYRRTADANPEQADTAARMDAILLARGDPQARVAEWRAMSERHPKSRMPRLQLAAAMTDAGETGPAADAFQTLLAEAPGDVEAQLGLADALARGGDGLAALEVVRALAPVTPEQTAAAAAALDRIAELLVARSETKAAAEVLRKSVALEPDNFQHTMLLAGVLEQLGDGDGALGLYRTIVTALPDSPKSSDRIDAIYAARGDAAGRAAEWRALAEKHPEAALPRERLADALARAGDPDGARAAREQADKNAGAAGS